MIRLDEHLLREVGLRSLPIASSDEVLSEVYEALESGVGSRLAELMSCETQDLLLAAVESGEHDRSMELLAESVPDYAQIVEEEAVIAKRWLASHARAILAVCWQPSGRARRR